MIFEKKSRAEFLRKVRRARLELQSGQYQRSRFHKHPVLVHVIPFAVLLHVSVNVTNVILQKQSRHARMQQVNRRVVHPTNVDMRDVKILRAEA